MKFRLIVFLVLLFSTGETLAPSRASSEIIPAQSSPRSLSLDPTKHISQYAHTAWRFQDGVLPGPIAITQTTDGYLWVGTSTGLLRFDGMKFATWDEISDQHLPGSEIISVLGARDGSLWIGTADGVMRWKDGQLTALPSLGGKVHAIIEDHNGAIWLGRIDVEDDRGGICQVVGNGLKFYGRNEGIPFNSVNGLAEDENSNLWVGSYMGLCRWNPQSLETSFKKEFAPGGLLGVWVLAAQKGNTLWTGAQLTGDRLELQRLDQNGWNPYPLPEGKGESGIYSLFVDREQNVWVGTGGRGFYRIHEGNVDHFDSSDGLSSDTVSGFFQDREGTLWVATSKGVDSFHDIRVVNFSNREGMSTDTASSVAATRDGRVWVGNSGALDVLKDGKLSAIRTGHGLPGRDVTTLFEDHTGRLWVGVDSGLYVYDGSQFRLIDQGITFALTEDANQTVWALIGRRLDRIENLEVRERITNPSIERAFKLVADTGGGIWLGLTNGDLIRYRNGQFETFPSILESKSKIQALAADPDGSIWAASKDGLLRWKEGTIKLLTQRDGLPCDDVYAMSNDGAGSLWLYAQCGIVALSKAELDAWWSQPDSRVSARTIDLFDGAQPVWTGKQPQAAQSPDGRLWFVNTSFLQMIDPTHLGMNQIPPPVQIQRVVIDGKTYLSKNALNRLSRARNIEIDYAGLSLVTAQKVRYQYKLEGHDPDWQESGTRRAAFYNDLPPGQYTFRVKACNNDGVWNEEGAALEFYIVPAFYQTRWFLLLCVVTAMGLAWAAYQWRVRWIAAQLDQRFEERLAERTRIAQDLHDTLLQGVLSASMQLHVANDRLGEDAPAKPLVERVLELMSRVTNEGRNALRGLRSSEENTQELDQAFSHVSQELTINRAVDFRVIVEGQPFPLHPMIRDEIYRIGREAIINAFRHSEAENIEVEIEYAAQELRVLVRDNGRGIDEHVLQSGRDGHFGLSGMRERAERIGARLRVWSRPAGGTEIEFFIPGNLAFRTPSSQVKRRRSSPI